MSGKSGGRAAAGASAAVERVVERVVERADVFLVDAGAGTRAWGETEARVGRPSATAAAGVGPVRRVRSAGATEAESRAGKTDRRDLAPLRRRARRGSVPPTDVTGRGRATEDQFGQPPRLRPDRSPWPAHPRLPPATGACVRFGSTGCKQFQDTPPDRRGRIAAVASELVGVVPAPRLGPPPSTSTLRRAISTAARSRAKRSAHRPGAHCRRARQSPEFSSGGERRPHGGLRR